MHLLREDRIDFVKLIYFQEINEKSQKKQQYIYTLQKFKDSLLARFCERKFHQQVNTWLITSRLHT